MAYDGVFILGLKSQNQYYHFPGFGVFSLVFQQFLITSISNYANYFFHYEQIYLPLKIEKKNLLKLQLASYDLTLKDPGF